MSLRTRLIAALIVLAAAGLVTLAAITYAEQRSLLFDRADQQTHEAQRAVSFALAGRPGAPAFGGRPPLAPPPPPGPRGDDARGPAGGSGPQGLPRGTYG